MSAIKVARPLFGGDGAGRPDEGGLQPPGRVEVAARPDHPDRGGAGPAVLETQVGAHGDDQAAVGVALLMVRALTPASSAKHEALGRLVQSLCGGEGRQ